MTRVLRVTHMAMVVRITHMLRFVFYQIEGVYYDDGGVEKCDWSSRHGRF